ncbi:primosomal protein N' (replication factor Y) - superfamily II helicase [Celeribacter arenosi]|uniref:Primosomal protein N' (Replication factor Y)-superfamily II helicase n=1 Tax=Celeribacter arenosi TaxID=792649 RepID=A0ABP7JSM9_9RHOB
MDEVATVHDDHRFPCGTCGADMRYAPGTRRLICDHCGATEPLDTAGAMPPREQDFARAIATGLHADGAETEEIRVSHCPNCGATVEFHATLHASECPYCATPVVADTGGHRQIKPHGLLPFALDEKTAHAAMSDWLGQLWFAPNGLRAYARKGRRLSGVYVPYWTFDADTQSGYRGERGDDYYVTKTIRRNGENVQVRQRKTRWRSKSGRVSRFFDDVLILASHALPRKYTEGLEPWDLSALEPYLPDYLAGFRSEAYAVRLDEGYAGAREYMDRVIRRDVKFDIGGDRQRIHDIDTKVRDVTYKHILLPVWMAAYKYRGRTYRFVVNGRTGRVQGERPFSAWKIAFAVLLGVIVAAGVGYAIALNEQGAFTSAY